MLINPNNQQDGQYHKLKTWATHFEDLATGFKTFEVRKNDRNFQKGDMLILQEYDPVLDYYTGHELTKWVSYILHGGQFGIEEGYCVMGLSDEPVDARY